MPSKTLVKKVQTAILIAAGLVLLKEAEANPVADKHELSSSVPGTLSSPNYPNPYSSNTVYSWIISAAPDDRINLKFDSFNLEVADNCRNDYVAIYDGYYGSDPLLGIFCGSNLPPSVMSTGNKMFMKFRSDGSVEPKGFLATYTSVSNIRYISGVEDTERNLTQYYLRTVRQRIRPTHKWGTHLPRTAVALFLNDPRLFVPGNKTGEEFAYELSLQLLSKLAMKKKVSTTDLALYINALIVACINPRDFFGINLVGELRKRVNDSNYTNPFSILTLCNAKDTITTNDVLKLQQQYDAHFRAVWTDTQAMVVMALSCINSRSRSDAYVDESILDEMVSELKKKQHTNGTIDNLKTTALVVQVLLAYGDYQTEFDVKGAIKFIIQEVGKAYPSTKDIYYILPILNSISLTNISSDHCETTVEADSEAMRKFSDHADEFIQVQISVNIGDNTHFSRTWKVKVPSNSSFYQVLEHIGSMEPAYKAQYSVSDGKPYVVSLSKFEDDTEDGMFWFIYTKPLSSTASPKLIEESPVDIQVKETDELILWYRSGFWAKSQEDSTD